MPLQARDYQGPPRPGFFKMRLVRHGPVLPAAIDQTCHCTINGSDANSPHQWLASCDRYPHLIADLDGNAIPVWKVWEWGTEIEKSKFEYLKASIEWDRQNDQSAPACRPDQPIITERVRANRYQP